MILNRQQILESNDLPKKEIQVPEWGGSIFIRTLTGTERDNFEISVSNNNLKNVRARMAVLCIVDEAGERLFEDKDAVELGKKSSAALSKIFDEAAEMNGLTEEHVKELEKN